MYRHSQGSQPVFLLISTGEKMKEAEIDALMQGQEDDNGAINYEGKSSTIFLLADFLSFRHFTCPLPQYILMSGRMVSLLLS